MAIASDSELPQKIFLVFFFNSCDYTRVVFN